MVQLAVMRPVSPECNAEPVLRCLLVDDSPHFLAAARGLLERQGIEVVGSASTGTEALDQAERLRPDVVLLDIELGGESGFDVAALLHRDGGSAGSAGSAIILISTHAREDYAELVAASPALGFLPKSELSAGTVRDLLADGR
jgi:two-component system nitrate/nitrite response regulator NarL